MSEKKNTIAEKVSDKQELYDAREHDRLTDLETVSSGEYGFGMQEIILPHEDLYGKKGMVYLFEPLEKGDYRSAKIAAGLYEDVFKSFYQEYDHKENIIDQKVYLLERKEDDIAPMLFVDASIMLSVMESDNDIKIAGQWLKEGSNYINKMRLLNRFRDTLKEYDIDARIESGTNDNKTEARAFKAYVPIGIQSFADLKDGNPQDKITEVENTVGDINKVDGLYQSVMFELVDDNINDLTFSVDTNKIDSQYQKAMTQYLEEKADGQSDNGVYYLNGFGHINTINALKDKLFDLKDKESNYQGNIDRSSAKTVLGLRITDVFKDNVVVEINLGDDLSEIREELLERIKSLSKFSDYWVEEGKSFKYDGHGLMTNLNENIVSLVNRFQYAKQSFEDMDFSDLPEHYSLSWKIDKNFEDTYAVIALDTDDELWKDKVMYQAMSQSNNYEEDGQYYYKFETQDDLEELKTRLISGEDNSEYYKSSHIEQIVTHWSGVTGLECFYDVEGLHIKFPVDAEDLAHAPYIPAGPQADVRDLYIQIANKYLLSAHKTTGLSDESEVVISSHINKINEINVARFQSSLEDVAYQQMVELNFEDRDGERRLIGFSADENMGQVSVMVNKVNRVLSEFTSEVKTSRGLKSVQVEGEWVWKLGKNFSMAKLQSYFEDNVDVEYINAFRNYVSVKHPADTNKSSSVIISADILSEDEDVIAGICDTIQPMVKSAMKKYQRYTHDYVEKAGYAIKEVLYKYIDDYYVYTDHARNVSANTVNSVAIRFESGKLGQLISKFFKQSIDEIMSKDLGYSQAQQDDILEDFLELDGELLNNEMNWAGLSIEDNTVYLPIEWIVLDYFSPDVSGQDNYVIRMALRRVSKRLEPYGLRLNSYQGIAKTNKDIGAWQKMLDTDERVEKAYKKEIEANKKDINAKASKSTGFFSRFKHGDDEMAM